MEIKSIKIESIQDVKSFFQILHQVYQLQFHPDDSFEDYVSIETGAATFSKVEAKYLNELMNKCFEVCEEAHEDIYLVGLSISHPEML